MALSVPVPIAAQTVPVTGVTFGPFDISGAQQIVLVLPFASVSVPAHTITLSYSDTGPTIITMGAGIPQAARGHGGTRDTFPMKAPGATVTVAFLPTAVMPIGNGSFTAS